MTHLFIANTTKQYVDFMYRIPEEKILRGPDRIAPGSQMIVGGNLSLDVVHHIIAQHEKVSNLRAAGEVKNIKTYTGLLYSIDKPVPLDNILVLFNKNDEYLDETAEERREDAAAAIAAATQSRVQDAGVRVARTEIEMSEDTTGDNGVSNAYEILAPNVEPRHGGKLGRRAKLANA